jgi:5'-nucleotidase
MNILLTNDDGVDAPGLAAAYRALEGLGTIHVVAPAIERSACSHTITLRSPIIVEKRCGALFGDFFAVDGTPADCVRVAFGGLLEEPIDLVLSGVNCGANAGVDVFYSGTIAGAREAAILGAASMAFSQAVREGVDLNWELTSEVTRRVLRRLLDEPRPSRGFWSVNFPSPLRAEHADAAVRVPVDLASTPMTFARVNRDDGRIIEFSNGAPYWDRDSAPPTDYTVIRDGGIAVTFIPLAAPTG